MATWQMNIKEFLARVLGVDSEVMGVINRISKYDESRIQTKVCRPQTWKTYTHWSLYNRVYYSHGHYMASGSRQNMSKYTGGHSNSQIISKYDESRIQTKVCRRWNWKTYTHWSLCNRVYYSHGHYMASGSRQNMSKYTGGHSNSQINQRRVQNRKGHRRWGQDMLHRFDIYERTWHD